MPGRRISLSIHSSCLSDNEGDSSAIQRISHEPLIRSIVTTDAQGQFSQNIVIPWETIRSHLSSLSSGLSLHEDSEMHGWPLVVVAELLPDEPNPLGASSANRSASPVLRRDHASRHENETPERNGVESFCPTGGHNHESILPTESKGQSSMGTTRETVRVSRSGGMRIISDLVSLSPRTFWTDVDRTTRSNTATSSLVPAKLSGRPKWKVDHVINHADYIRNVFCRPLEDTCVPGMDELFRNMAEAGINGCHFVVRI
jgi:hypothetical protein